MAALDWSDYKRNVVYQMVDSIAAKPSMRDQLIDLMLATADIQDPHWLRKVDDGERKYEQAIQSLAALREYTEPMRQRRSEVEEAERRQREEAARMEVQRAIRETLTELQSVLQQITRSDPQARGYTLDGSYVASGLG